MPMISQGRQSRPEHAVPNLTRHRPEDYLQNLFSVGEACFQTSPQGKPYLTEAMLSLGRFG